jgi:invasion protein IalB
MLRISAFVAVLTVLLTTGALAAPKDQSNSYPNCYSQNCPSECAAKSVYKGCEIICQRMASTKPPCK